MLERKELSTKFQKWLNSNSTILPRSRKDYLNIVKSFLFEYREPSVENINKFLSEKGIHKYRYPFKYLLQFLEREADYKKLIKIRRKPRKRHGVFVTRVKVKEILDNVKDPIYYFAAAVQFYTGARAHDVLGLRTDDIVEEDDGITFHFRAKGDREHMGFIPFDYPEAPGLISLIKQMKKEHPFLRGSSKDHTTWVDNNYRYYVEQIKRAADAAGVKGFRTHDFRRNFATSIYGATKDVLLTQKILGHAKMEDTLKYIKKVEKEEIKKALRKLK